MSSEVLEGREACNFTVSWMSRTWDEAREQCEGQPFDHISCDNFRRRGLLSGDNLYSLIVKSGRLHLCAWMLVYDITDSECAEHILGTPSYEAEDHAFAAEATVMRFNRVVPLQVVEQIRFEQRNGLVAPKFKSDGALDPHAFRGVRVITPESAELLEALLESEEIHTFDYSDWEGSDDNDELGDGEGECKEEEGEVPAVSVDMLASAERLVRTSQTCEEFIRRIPREWLGSRQTTLQEFEWFMRLRRDSYVKTVNGVQEKVSVETPRQFYEIVRHRDLQTSGLTTFNPETDSKLRALIHAGVKPDDAILVLRRSLSFRGGRFLAVSALERDVLPHLSASLTAQQADFLVRLARNAYDEEETVKAIQAL